MRISDWSSDVCSSDLEHNALFRAKARLADFTFARETSFTVKVLFRPQDDRHEQHRQRHAYDRASPKRFGHDRIMPVIPEEAGERERIISRGGHLKEEPRHRAGQQADQQERDRSEEHTSELQSLMRISYAVFCLKKKNTNRTRLKSNTS